MGGQGRPMSRAHTHPLDTGNHHNNVLPIIKFLWNPLEDFGMDFNYWSPCINLCMKKGTYLKMGICFLSKHFKNKLLFHSIEYFLWILGTKNYICKILH